MDGRRGELVTVMVVTMEDFLYIERERKRNEKNKKIN
jgi:hypothetical protein